MPTGVPEVTQFVAEVAAEVDKAGVMVSQTPTWPPLVVPLPEAESEESRDMEDSESEESTSSSDLPPLPPLPPGLEAEQED